LVAGSNPAIPTIKTGILMPMPEQPQNVEQFPLDPRVAILQSEDATPEAKEQAFGEIYEEYASYFGAYFKKATHSSDRVVEEIVQEVFLRIWRALPNYTPTGAPIEVWFKKIIHNLTLDYKRMASGKPEVLFDPEAPFKTENQNYIGISQHRLPEEVVIVKDTLDRLKEVNNYEILMQRIMGLTPSEISEKHDITLLAVHGRIHKARLAAQSVIKDQMAA
jgi:RNA polymerase sigma factor (sigma-70 family)